MTLEAVNKGLSINQYFDQLNIAEEKLITETREANGSSADLALQPDGTWASFEIAKTPNEIGIDYFTKIANGIFDDFVPKGKKRESIRVAFNEMIALIANIDKDNMIDKGDEFKAILSLTETLINHTLGNIKVTHGEAGIEYAPNNNFVDVFEGVDHEPIEAVMNGILKPQ